MTRPTTTASTTETNATINNRVWQTTPGKFIAYLRKEIRRVRLCVRRRPRDPLTRSDRHSQLPAASGSQGLLRK